MPEPSPALKEAPYAICPNGWNSWPGVIIHESPVYLKILSCEGRQSRLWDPNMFKDFKIMKKQ